MSKNKLDILFQSHIRVKILKFIFRNPELVFSIDDLAQRLREDPERICDELDSLLEINLIKKNDKVKKDKADKSYIINNEFEYISELKDLVLKSSPNEKNEILRSLTSTGSMKLVLISGIFINSNRVNAGIVDLFIVADDIDKKKFNDFLRNLEAEVGTEITYSLMEKEEFQYRLSMFDRFVSIMLESPHEKLIDKIDIQISPQ